MVRQINESWLRRSFDATLSAAARTGPRSPELWDVSLEVAAGYCNTDFHIPASQTSAIFRHLASRFQSGVETHAEMAIFMGVIHHGYLEPTGTAR